MKHIYIFPRYSGNENADWYQKAKAEIMIKNSQTLVTPLSLPNWDKPEIAEFLSFIEYLIPLGDIDADTYFVGHSVGCRAALLYLNELQQRKPGLKIGGLMCVAGWWSVDNPWPQLEQWINISFDCKKMADICNHNIIALISDNDPYTTDTQTNKNIWEEQIDAKVVIVPEAKHFNYDGYEEIIEELLLFIDR